MSNKITHPEMVKALCKPGQAILDSLDAKSTHLLHMSSKLSSEAGELIDAVGKVCFYEKELDMENVTEELGDMEFYMQGIRESLGITREQTLKANIKKLEKRYENFVFSNKQAQERKDKMKEFTL